MTQRICCPGCVGASREPFDGVSCQNTTLLTFINLEFNGEYAAIWSCLSYNFGDERLFLDYKQQTLPKPLL